MALYVETEIADIVVNSLLIIAVSGHNRRAL